LPSLPTDLRFKAEQFIIAPDEKYSALRARLIERVENIEDDPFYSPDFENLLIGDYHNVLTLEEHLVEGIQLIINEMAIAGNLSWCSFARACHWFARIIRTKLFAILFNCQNPKLDKVVEWDKEWNPSPLGFNRDAKVFFGVDAIESIDIGLNAAAGIYSDKGELFGMTNHIHAWIDNQSDIIKNLTEFMSPAKVLMFGSETFSKYIIPQMVYYYLRDRNTHSPSPITWDFKDHYVYFA
jgi:hypothetical protein